MQGLGMADPPQPSSEVDPDVHDGLSVFIARVLGQLSLSAWLPAAFCTLVITILAAMRFGNSLSIQAAIAKIVADPWAFLLLAGPVLVCATLLIQAFSFEAIRFLEGYSVVPLVGVPVAAILTRIQVARRHAHDSGRRKLVRRAWRDSRHRWIDDDFDARIVDALEADALGKTRPALEPSLLNELKELQWWHLADPWVVARIDRRRVREAEFPGIESRTLPTRLGNLLRATEDDLQQAGDDVQAFVMRQREKASLRLRVQHDQFRTRLDMYCVLTLVAFGLAFGAPAVLWGVPNQETSTLVEVWTVRITEAGLIKAAIAGSLLLVSWASYSAAIASARGYVTILRQMDRL